MNLYTFVPYSTEKNFGGAINKHCELVPNLDDWICIRDGDACNLTPDWGHIIQEAIDQYGHEYKLFGCWTNRLNKTSKQLVKGMYDERDMKAHYLYAEWLGQEPTGITPTKKVTGPFMLFQKRTWLEAGKFKEFDKTFDSKFSKAVKGKIGLINRLYMFHLYRIWVDGDPSREVKHLMR